MELTQDEQLTQILKMQADITCYEVAKFCAMICDKHRGHLQIGDMIRQHFGLKELVKTLPINPNPTPDVTDVNFEVPEKKRHLSVVK